MVDAVRGLALVNLVDVAARPDHLEAEYLALPDPFLVTTATTAPSIDLTQCHWTSGFDRESFPFPL